MQIKKREVQIKIYEGAVKVFYEKGYKSATMSEISKASGVPIGNIYRYYKNKINLFDAVVFKIYTKLKYIHYHEELEVPTLNFKGRARDFLNTYITVSTSTPIEFRILFDCSAGTQYENFVQELVEIRFLKYLEFVKETVKKTEILDEKFIRIIVEAGMTSIISICKKYSNDEKLLRYYLMKFDYFFRGDLDKNLIFSVKN